MGRVEEDLRRCKWATGDKLLLDYHDREWGVPLHDDRHLFELLILEGAQAGLSWLTILRKREGYRTAFRGFNPEVVAQFGPDDVEQLAQSTLIIRNRRKIAAAVQNAKSFLEIVRDRGSFDRYIWSFVDGKTIENAWKSSDDIPSTTNESRAMSKDLLKRGFSFVGPTICYAFMQSAGMINDHVLDCFRHRQLSTNQHQA